MPLRRIRRYRKRRRGGGFIDDLGNKISRGLEKFGVGRSILSLRNRLRDYKPITKLGQSTVGKILRMAPVIGGPVSKILDIGQSLGVGKKRKYRKKRRF